MEKIVKKPIDLRFYGIFRIIFAFLCVLPNYSAYRSITVIAGDIYLFKYEDLLAEVERFCNAGVETGTIGESELRQSIPYIFVGSKNGNYAIVQGAMHAREHLTALAVVCLAKYLVKNPQLKLDGGIYFIPMTNPDGVRLCQEGVGFIEDKERKSNLLAINGSADFSLWKANIDGVDLNVNFDAKWGEGDQNEFFKSSQNYVGKEPFSAAESRALAEFTERVNPCVTLSYHLKGEEVYWEFGQTSHRAGNTGQRRRLQGLVRRKVTYSRFYNRSRRGQVFSPVPVFAVGRNSAAKRRSSASAVKYSGQGQVGRRQLAAFRRRVRIVFLKFICVKLSV